MKVYEKLHPGHLRRCTAIFLLIITTGNITFSNAFITRPFAKSGSLITLNQIKTETAQESVNGTVQQQPPKPSSPKPFVVAKRRSKKPALADKGGADAVVVKRKTKKRSVDLIDSWEAGAAHFNVVKVINFDKESKHTVIVAKKMLEEMIDYGGEGINSQNCDAGTVAKCCIQFLLDKGMSVENTEGMIDASQFPVNYFEASQIGYFYPEYKDDLVRLIKKEGNKLNPTAAP